MKNRRRLYASLAVGGVILIAVLVAIFGGRHEGPGEVFPEPVPSEVIAERARAQRSTAAELAKSGVQGPQAKQILFGDLHVHTTFSPDAFMRSLPLVAGEGTHPPADACDYARYCSALDFFALTDHAEALTQRHWRETIESIQQCNAVAGDPADPDLAAFVGFEWTQVGATAEDHYGHKNVIFRATSDDQLPARPISADGPLTEILRDSQINLQTIWIPFIDGQNISRYGDYRRYRAEIAAMPDCPRDVPVHDLPLDCRELASTPAELFAKLDEWGFDALVIPHGSTWGFYTPPGYSWDKQLDPAQDDPDRQRLVEVYSGHGNSEEYRAWRAAEGEICPEPRPGFEPCCWRAGELIRARCGDIPEAECEARVERTRALYVEGGAGGHLVVPGSKVEDWLGCDQCLDCFNPSYAYRPGGSAQYMLAKGHFEAPDQPPRHATYGFIASSDNHLARPGTGYKEFARHGNTEAVGARAPRFDRFLLGPEREPSGEPERFAEVAPSVPPFARTSIERQASFFMTGGLVAVHSAGRDHDSIYAALERREVYGTSGERILLWFDLLGRGTGEVQAPMGSEVELGFGSIPRFRVRAAGSFVQASGCPDWVHERIGAERIRALCLDECHNPTGERHAIESIEVVRIRPQQRPDEPIESLIEDPWMRFPCDDQEGGCTVEFEDPEFGMMGRTFVYYARAIMAPTPAVNAGGLRCVDEACTELDPCYGDFRTPREDDCLSDNRERAWSSPIWLRASEAQP